MTKSDRIKALEESIEILNKRNQGRIKDNEEVWEVLNGLIEHLGLDYFQGIVWKKKEKK